MRRVVGRRLNRAAYPATLSPRYSQSAGSPDLLLHTGHADTTSSLLDSPDHLASPLTAPDSPPSDDVTAQASVLSVSAETPSLSLEGIRDAQANDENIQPVLKVLAGCARPTMVFCNCLLSDMAIANRLLLAMTMWLSQLLVRAECSIDNASLIGRCAKMLASSPKVNNYAAVSIVVRGNCCRLLVTQIVWCATLFDLSLLRIYLIASDSLRAVSMSDVPESTMSTDPKVVEGGDATDDPCGGALYSWPRDLIPASGGGTRCHSTLTLGQACPRSCQTYGRRPLSPHGY